jgi:putative cofactor-binding repeat protein
MNLPILYPHEFSAGLPPGTKNTLLSYMCWDHLVRKLLPYVLLIEDIELMTGTILLAMVNSALGNTNSDGTEYSGSLAFMASGIGDHRGTTIPSGGIGCMGFNASPASPLNHTGRYVWASSNGSVVSGNTMVEVVTHFSTHRMGDSSLANV